MTSRQPNTHLSTTPFEPNPDTRRRDELLGVRPRVRAPGSEPFGDLDAVRVRALIEERFVDPARRHHHSPSVGDLAEFMDRWPQTSAHGTLVGVTDAGSRIAIEGLECDTTQIPQVAREAFYEEFGWFCGDATDFIEDSDYVYARWQ